MSLLMSDQVIAVRIRLAEFDRACCLGDLVAAVMAAVRLAREVPMLLDVVERDGGDDG